MEGVIADGKELMEEDANPEVMDAGLIGAAQHVEHYEIAGYGCVRTYAELLGHSNFAAYCRRRWTRKRRPTKNSPRARAKHQRGSRKSSLTSIEVKALCSEIRRRVFSR